MISQGENSHLSTAWSMFVPGGERDSLLKAARELAQREMARGRPSRAEMRNRTWAASTSRSPVQEMNVATGLGTPIYGVATAAPSFHAQIPLHRHDGRCQGPPARPKLACLSAHPRPLHRGFPNTWGLNRPIPSHKRDHPSRARGLPVQLLKGKVAKAEISYTVTLFEATQVQYSR